MRRVAVIGSGGSGKSTFAAALGTRLGIDVIHLDRFYWQPVWVSLSGVLRRWARHYVAAIEAHAAEAELIVIQSRRDAARGLAAAAPVTHP